MYLVVVVFPTVAVVFQSVDVAIPSAVILEVEASSEDQIPPGNAVLAVETCSTTNARYAARMHIINLLIIITLCLDLNVLSARLLFKSVCSIKLI